MNSVRAGFLYLYSAFTNVCSNMIVKCFGAWMYVVYSFAFGTVQAQADLAILVLVSFDFITAIANAKKKGDPITGSQALHTPVKIVFYAILISAAHLTGLTAPVVSDMFDYTITAFLAITELISIMENLGKMGIAIPQKMLNTLQSLKNEQ